MPSNPKRVFTTLNDINKQNNACREAKRNQPALANREILIPSWPELERKVHPSVLGDVPMAF